MKVPVLYLAYNRPEVTKISFEALRQNRPETLFIAVDGPRNRVDAISVDAVRSIVQNVDWPCQVAYLIREENAGLRKGVNGAIDWFFAHVSEGIILEDDIIPSKRFFQFCADMLEEYRDEWRVWMISGTNMLLHWKPSKASHFFATGSVWGWATWADRWRQHDQSMSSWSDESQRHRAEDTLGAAWYRVQRDLEMLSSGQLESWAYPWMFTQASRGARSAMPICNLVQNIGSGPKATHTKVESSQWRPIASGKIASFPTASSILIDHEYIRRVESRLLHDRRLRRIRPLINFWDRTRAIVQQSTRKVVHRSGSGDSMFVVHSMWPRVTKHLVRNPADVRWLFSWLRLRHQSPVDAGLPWLPFRVTAMMAKEITSRTRVFEFGGGGSTKWFIASGADKVITVEHDNEWRKVLDTIVPSTDKHQMLAIDLDEAEGRAYVESIRTVEDGSLDIVVVDGRRRVDCAEEAIPKLRRGGLLLLDDIDRERYQSVYGMLADWPTERIDGLCPGKPQLGHVAVFRKP